ncbi:glycoside hydrolase family 127 protein [Mucilaginibacter daejeonensis]|uniref:glycoside hydrolase family 127 protein n=1 Tax=Mucilaginibacter daejeonensis TaxID=398049 RepID=UPI001D17B4E0|nr:glycoside hydrolase family 127 protein [Mucilaginibacter daejeonensis]UEG52267.1 glycoside hydrolase family 127 protein [Mucilaginibacter daejeonensis]
MIKYLSTALLAVTVSVACAQERLYSNEFPLKDVTLLDGDFKHARDLNVRTLLKYDADRLLAGYRVIAHLPVKAKIYPNWDGLDGHVGGHYLSALAISYASTGDARCGERMRYFIKELKACQDANTANNPEWGVGYVGAVPNSDKVWSTFKNGDFGAYRSAWVPWYNVHKMYAGLRDVWVYNGDATAKDIFLKFCDWGIDITSALTDEQMQAMLATEHGGMNEIYADAYQMTHDDKYLKAAKRFSHRALLDPMAQGRDDLDNKHANTQVPKAVGFQRIAELDHDDTYARAGQFFWETVTADRTLAFGGNSRREFFPSKTAATDLVNDVEGPETCNSYNMLKLTEDLFRVQPMAKYADYYERTLYNHILSSQHPQHGGFVYFTPARPRHYRVYSSPNEGMWCCVGSGMENQSKYAQFIYTHYQNTLYVNLFMPSVLNWRQKGVVIRQETAFPYQENSKLSITSGKAHFKMMIRYPGWVNAGALKISVNGKPVKYTAQPSSYVAIDRAWKKGDVVQISLPMHNSVEQLPYVPNYVAVLHGPIVLASNTGTEDLKGLVAGDSRWGHIASGRKLPLDKAPIFVEDDEARIATQLKPVAGKPLNFTMAGDNLGNGEPVKLEPFFKIHDARYMMYWMTLTHGQYRSYVDSMAAVERDKMALDKRTIDQVAPGEQQPEVDHSMQTKNSNTGNNYDEFWRDARNGGYFSYDLATNDEKGLKLMVRYRGGEQRDKAFDIYIDDQKLMTLNGPDKGNAGKFMNVEYDIPDSLTRGKKRIRVKFQAHDNSAVSAVYNVKLLRK